MALVATVHKGPDPLISARNVPRKQWRALTYARAGYCRKTFQQDCLKLLFFISDARENEFLGYPDEESYLRDGLSLDPLTVSVVAEYLRAHGEEAIGFDAAADIQRRMAAKEAREQAEHRPQGKHRELHHAIGMMKQGSNNAAYLLRRLARDHPDILKCYERGEFKSVRAAAMAAGIIKPSSPLDQLRKAWAKATRDERSTFLSEVEI